MVGWYSSKPKTYAPRRRKPRKQTHVPAVIRSVNGAEIVCNCLVVDVSEGGARLQLDWPGLIPDNVMLVLSSNGLAHRRCEVRWRSETEIGVQFLRPQRPESGN